MKMSILLALTLTMFSLSVAQHTKIKLEVGAVLDAKYVLKKPIKPDNFYKSGPSQYDPHIVKVIDGIEYLIAYDKDSHKITYIYTYDRKFKTVDGLQVGKVLDLRKEQVTLISGWNIYAPETKDGWKPLIGVNESPFTIDGIEGEIHWDVTEGFLKSEVIHVKLWGFVKGGH